MSSKWILSATEIETFATCRRKWGYIYLDGIKPPPSQAAALGTDVHEFLKKHLTGYSIKYDTNEGQIASAGLRYLPKILPSSCVERPFAFINNGHIFSGYIDFCQQIDEQAWLIGDHKTCSSFATALPSHELKKNTQALIYAQWAFQEMGAQSVKLNWVYYRTKSTPQARLVEAEIKSDEALKLFKPQLQIASDIKELVENRVATADLPKNLSACFKYGRCPFYARCKHSVKATAANHIEAPVTINECQSNKKSFHLFVDCLPTKQNAPYEHTIELSELLKPVLEKISTEKNLRHYRLAGYGQHVGLMADYLAEHLKNKAFDHRTAILSSSKTPEGIDTLQTLSAAAEVVVRGF